MLIYDVKKMLQSMERVEDLSSLPEEEFITIIAMSIDHWIARHKDDPDTESKTWTDVLTTLVPVMHLVNKTLGEVELNDND